MQCDLIPQYYINHVYLLYSTESQSLFLSHSMEFYDHVYNKEYCNVTPHRKKYLGKCFVFVNLKSKM